MAEVHPHRQSKKSQFFRLCTSGPIYGLHP